MKASQVLFCPPTYFEVRDVKNPFMDPDAPVDKALACRQWEDVVRCFTEAGAGTHTLPAVADLEDMVFANNQVFVGYHPAQPPFIVPSRMRFESRRREVPHYVDWFRARGYKVIDLDLGDEFLEGHGDLLWHADMSKVWAGFGIRSTRDGVEKFAAAMGEMSVPVVPLQLVDPVFYHLDTCLAPLTAEAVLIYPGAFAPEALQAIRANVARVHEVSRDDAMHFVCNGVAVNGKFITAWAGDDIRRILEAESLETVVVDTSEFEKSGGSVCCLKLFVA